MASDLTIPQEKGYHRFGSTDSMGRAHGGASIFVRSHLLQSQSDLATHLQAVGVKNSETLHVEYPHVSIVKSVEELKSVKCGEKNCPCYKTAKFHCKLCSTDHFAVSYSQKIEAHVAAYHWKFRYEYGDHYVIRCQLPCKPIAHFHCPKCGGAYLGCIRIHAHISNCKGTPLRSGGVSPRMSDKSVRKKRGSTGKQLIGWESDEEIAASENLQAKSEARRISTEQVQVTDVCQDLVNSPRFPCQDSAEACDDGPEAIRLRLASGMSSNHPSEQQASANVEEKVMQLLDGSSSVNSAIPKNESKEYTVQVSDKTNNESGVTLLLTKQQRIEKVKEKIGNFYHKSMITCLADLELDPCTNCCNGKHYHCPLCPTSIWPPGQLRRLQLHLSRQHWRLRYTYEEVHILRCSLQCEGNEQPSSLMPFRTHWHCPRCTHTFPNRHRFRMHMEAHERGTVKTLNWSKQLTPVWYIDELMEGVALPPELGGLEAADVHDTGWNTGDSDVVFTAEEIQEESRPKKVFQIVAALLMPEILDLIPGSKEAFLNTLYESTSVQCTLTSEKYCLLQGDWNEIEGAHKVLDAILHNQPKTEEEVKQIITNPTLVETQELPDNEEDEYQNKETKHLLDMRIMSPTKKRRGFSRKHRKLRSKENEEDDGIAKSLAAEIQLVDGESENIENCDNDFSKDLAQRKVTPQRDVTNAELKAANKTEIDAVQEVNVEEIKIKRGRGRPRKPKVDQQEKTTEKIVNSNGASPKVAIPSVEDLSKQKLVIRTRKQRQAELNQCMLESKMTVEEELFNKEKTASATNNASVQKNTKSNGDECSVCESDVTEESAKRKRIYSEGTESMKKIKTSGSEMVLVSEPSTVMLNDDHGEEMLNEGRVEGESVNMDENTGVMEINASTDLNIKKEMLFSCEEEAGDCIIKLTLPSNDGNVKPEPVDLAGEVGERSVEMTEQEFYSMEPPVAEAVAQAQADGRVTFTNEELKNIIKKRRAIQICPKCKKVYTNRTQLFDHIFLNTCKVLNQLSQVPAKLRGVLKDALESVSEAKCPLCSKTFKAKKNAFMHYALKVCRKATMTNELGLDRTEDGLYQCRHCTFQHSKPSSVKIHEANKHWVKTHECPVCHRMYGLESLLKCHIRQVHMTRNIPKITCHICGKETLSKHFSQHMKRDHDPNYVKPKYKPLEKYIACPHEGCKYQTRHMPDYRKHLKKVHGTKDKVCDLCGQKFALGTELNMHKKVKHGLNRESLLAKCPHCAKKMLKRNLKNHVKLVHDKVKEFTCPKCDADFTTKNSLNVHIERHKPAHERMAKYLCADCGKGFINKTAYTDHTNVHTGFRPYLCKHCGKSFKQQSAYGKHMEIHKGVKHFCDQCPNSFALQKYLTQHKKRVHDQYQTRFLCTCGKEYQTYPKLCSHRKNCQSWEEQQNPPFVVSASSEEQTTLYLQTEDGQQLFQAVQEEGEEGQTLVVLEAIQGEGDAVTMAAAAAMEDGVMGIISKDDTGEMQLIMNDAQIESEGDLQEMALVTDAELPEEGSLDRYLCGCCQQLFVSLEVVQDHMLKEHMQDMPQIE